MRVVPHRRWIHAVDVRRKSPCRDGLSPRRTPRRRLVRELPSAEGEGHDLQDREHAMRGLPRRCPQRPVRGPQGRAARVATTSRGSCPRSSRSFGIARLVFRSPAPIWPCRAPTATRPTTRAWGSTCSRTARARSAMHDPHRGEFRARMAALKPDGSPEGCEACHDTDRWTVLRAVRSLDVALSALGRAPGRRLRRLPSPAESRDHDAKRELPGCAEGLRGLSRGSARRAVRRRART